MKALPLALAVLSCNLGLRADDAKVLPGHSAGGEAFNEGPRQRAVLMEGTGAVHFPITAKGLDAQRYFDQGVGQLHGFWYFEAERSFRQVAAIDPKCAMAYWGMAMANFNNTKRAGEFIKKAVALKQDITRREQLWVGALADYYASPQGDIKARRRSLVRAWEKLSAEFPEDLEAKAFLVEMIWDNAGRGWPIGSHQAVDALAREVLAVNPQHPVHHYRIHLWNSEDDKRALDSAALCGQSAPAIAHMWHMPGHTFTKLNRYADAAWQQEAAARVDHAQMAASRILPEQIHNYAHNNDWLVENLQYVGRAHEAVDLAKNMIELPRMAPMAVTVGKRGDTPEGRSGSSMGRQRLIETALRYELWPELTALDGTMYLPPSDDPVTEVRRLTAFGVAWYEQGDLQRGDEKHAAVEAEAARVRELRMTAAEQAEDKAREQKPAEQKPPADQPAGGQTPGRPTYGQTPGRQVSGGQAAPGSDVNRLVAEALAPTAERSNATRTALAELRLYRALANHRPDDARAQLKLVKKLPPERLARLQWRLGDGPAAEKTLRDAQARTAGQVLPLAALAALQWELGKKAEARETFGKLRPLAAQVDLDTPPFARLAPIAQELDLPADWRPELKWAADSGQRPALASLGPFRWQPYAAPSWNLTDDDGQSKSLADYHGRPVLVVFYLGSGCPRCLEQLNLFSPMTKAYRDAGIEIVAVSTDSPEALHETFAKSEGGKGFEFPILADPSLDTFRAYRAFDDFEKIPLHGVFLLDGEGRVRWQDISFEAFKDPKWLLTESKRLLALPGATASTDVTAKR
jgi:peroxiredoxin